MIGKYILYMFPKWLSLGSRCWSFSHRLVCLKGKGAPQACLGKPSLWGPAFGA